MILRKRCYIILINSLNRNAFCLKTMKVIKLFRNISMRHAIKTAIACLLADIVTLLLHLPEGYWAVISAGIIMQSSLETGSFETTIILGFERILGTVFGAILGVIGLLLSFNSIAISLPIIFIIMLLSTYLSSRFKQLRMMGVTAIIVVVIGIQPGQHGLMLGLFRCAQIILGCTIAVIVTITIWPQRIKDHLNQKIINILVTSKDLYSKIVQIYSSPPSASAAKTHRVLLDKIITTINSNIANCDQLKSKASKHKFILGERYLAIQLILNNMLYQLRQMAVSVELSKAYLYSKELDTILNKLADLLETYIDTLSDKIVKKKKQKITNTNNLAIMMLQLENLMSKLRKSSRHEQLLQKSLNDAYAYLNFFQANKYFINEFIKLYDLYCD